MVSLISPNVARYAAMLEKNPGRCRRAVDYVNPHIRQQSPPLPPLPLSPVYARERELDP